MNYCFGCHALAFSRYNRMANVIGFPVDPDIVGDEMASANLKLLSENLIFTTNDEGKPTNAGALMKSAIPAKDAGKWFGAPPPDLSLVGRSRGSDWIYTYLKNFYLDPKRPTGVNNTTFPNVGMPHVLWELQGWQTLESHKDESGHEHKSLHLAKQGSLSPAEYEGVVRDITNFLTYVSEPAQLHRSGYGIFAMLLLLVFIGLAYLLKKEYWKDVH
jgi:ubiquinol-cytochrome c reductase cytochrome c1 subunit